MIFFVSRISDHFIIIFLYQIKNTSEIVTRIPKESSSDRMVVEEKKTGVNIISNDFDFHPKTFFTFRA